MNPPIGLNMTTTTDTKYECRFAVYSKPPEHNAPDMHLIKLIRHDPDGTKTPEVKLVYDYQRSFYVTKPGQRNYKQHREWIDKEHLIENKSSQSNLVQAASRALGMQWFKGDLRKLCENPYLFGADILSTAIIKRSFMKKYPKLQTGYSVAVCDIETDVLSESKEIIMISITHKTKVVTAVVKKYVEGIINLEEKFREKMQLYLGDVIAARNINFELHVCDDPVDAIRTVLNVAHEIKPDFLAFWNMDFDITNIIKACEKQGVDPKDIFSDPIVPKEYRFFKYKQGPKKKVTASGKVTPIKPAAQWHTLFTTSSFYPIDAMCVYKHIRTGKQEEPSYSLDAILDKILGIRKLKFKEADHLKKLRWHQFMQKNYKIEYMVYNVFDCISIEMLDEKTTDLSITFPMFSGHSDFENFKSQPRRAVDNLHYFALDNNKIIGVTPPSKEEIKNDETLDDEEKDEIYGLEGWICTLPANLITENGIKCIEEYPNLKSNIYTHVGDRKFV